MSRARTNQATLIVDLRRLVHQGRRDLAVDLLPSQIHERDPIDLETGCHCFAETGNESGMNDYLRWLQF